MYYHLYLYNEMTEAIPVKLMLIINAVNKDNVETHRLLGTLYNEFKDGNLKQYCESEQLIQAISNNANDIATAVKTGIKEMDLQKAEKGKLNTNAFKCKNRISHLRNNTLYSRQQTFLPILSIKQILEVYEKLLESTPDVKEVPPTDNGKSNKRRNKNPKTIIVEKFKLEISLQDLLSEKPETRLNNVDANMIKHFLVNYESNICETSKINRINRETINTIIVALAVEVTTNITHMNPQQTKMTKKE